MLDIIGFLDTAAEKNGFIRSIKDQSNIPTDSANICCMPFFGDLRSTFVLASLLLNRFKQVYPSKYLILCSWPGFQGLFPYVDEYWALQDTENIAKLYSSTNQFSNKSDLAVSICRNLNQYFFKDLAIPSDFFADVYNNGLLNGYWEQYKNIERFLPQIPPAAQLSKSFVRELEYKGGYKVFVYPSRYLSQWKNNSVSQLSVSKDFWVVLLERLLKEHITPVICKTPLAHDLSEDFVDKCIYFNVESVSQLLCCMRSIGCVLDIFSGISRLAIAARCPFLYVDERIRYVNIKEYEVDDLCAQKLPKQYIFSLPTIIQDGNIDAWNFSIIDGVIARLIFLAEHMDRETWPTTKESTEILSYDVVRKNKFRGIGTKFLRISGS